MVSPGFPGYLRVGHDHRLAGGGFRVPLGLRGCRVFRWRGLVRDGARIPQGFLGCRGSRRRWLCRLNRGFLVPLGCRVPLGSRGTLQPSFVWRSAVSTREAALIGAGSERRRRTDLS
jgi:hypothetical protein